MFRKKSKEKKNRRISQAVAEAIMSGDDWLEATQILQALRPVEDLIEAQIEGLQEILEDYREAGGTMAIEDREDGHDLVAALGDVTWRLAFDSRGQIVKRIIEDTAPEHADADALGMVDRAIRAAYEIPRREFALEELQRIVAYVENDNALAGLERVRELLSNNENIVYQTASSAGLADVDMSAIAPIMEVRK
ncbi:MAG TPA: hypothetical protein PKI40_09870 [Methanomassiliicoccaceae archaeon]|nr:hypothetical protein [Methanomassiliicoccaceae archaeon]